VNGFCIRLAALLACVAALACGPAWAEAQTSAQAQIQTAEPAPAAHSGDGGEHQVLVMLRLPAAHYRPDASYGGRYIDDSGRSARHRRAEALARQHGLTLVDDWPMPVLGLDCYVMRYADSDNAERIIALLTRDPQVEWAQAVARFSGMGAADAATTAPPSTASITATAATAASSADALYPVQPAARYWHLAELHRYTTGREIKVAVIDSGVDAGHPDLQGQLADNANFVDAGPAPAENHGTAVAGIIGARAGNGGIVGVAPRARLMGLRACWQLPDLATRCNSFTLAKAINYAILNGAKVINLSLSGPPDRLLDRLLDVALERGIGVVGAVDTQAAGATFPASHRGVLAVASQASGGKAGGAMAAAATATSAPPAQALLAPGNDIPATAPGGRWSFVSGSSYAAAHVSGMLALLDELQPGATPAQLRALLQPSALNAGNIDACAAISRLVRNCGCACPAGILTQRSVRP
jgi:subtilisin family serine protease